MTNQCATSHLTPTDINKAVKNYTTLEYDTGEQKWCTVCVGRGFGYHSNTQIVTRVTCKFKLKEGFLQHS